jgi:hypothetical protein
MNDQHGFFDPTTQPSEQQYLPFDTSDRPTGHLEESPKVETPAQIPTKTEWQKIKEGLLIAISTGAMLLSLAFIKIYIEHWSRDARQLPEHIDFSTLPDPEKALTATDNRKLDGMLETQRRLGNLIKDGNYQEAARCARTLGETVGLMDAKLMARINKEYPQRIKDLQATYHDLARCLDKKDDDGVLRAIERIEAHGKWSMSIMPEKYRAFLKSRVEQGSTDIPAVASPKE